jgi:hypothetical protein
VLLPHALWLLLTQPLLLMMLMPTLPVALPHGRNRSMTAATKGSVLRDRADWLLLLVPGLNMGLPAVWALLLLLMLLLPVVVTAMRLLLVWCIKQTCDDQLLLTALPLCLWLLCHGSTGGSTGEGCSCYCGWWCLWYCWCRGIIRQCHGVTITPLIITETQQASKSCAHGVPTLLLLLLWLLELLEWLLLH